MKAAIITIGEEIISGQTLDTNSAYISRKLSEIGIEVVKRISVGDRHEDITSAIIDCWHRMEVTIATGGLGPTVDDITKKAICTAFDRNLIFHDDILKWLEDRYRDRNQKMPAIVQNQALQPQGADLIPNPIGSALGIVFQNEEKYFVALPGVPSEMEAILDQSVVLALRKRQGRLYIEMRRIRTTGITESEIAETISDLEPASEQLRLAYLPSYRGVDLRVTANSLEETDAKTQADKLTEAIVSRIGDYIYTIGESSLPEVLGSILIEQGKTLSTAESCTGGLVAAMLTDIPGSSRYFLGSIVSYSNEIKERALRVPPELINEHGAVSPQVAEAMASGVRIAIGSDYSIAITGIAGPDGGTPEKPVGLVYVACAGPDFLISKRLSLFGTRKRIRERSAIMALEMMRRKLLEKS